MFKLRVTGLVLLSCAFVLTGSNSTEKQDRLWEYRNLGKAFYENPDTHVQAAEQLAKALALAPDSVGERINYGLALLRAGQTERGMAELIQAQKQDPSVPHTWFNLGIAYKKAGDYDKAVEQFRGMLLLTPNEPAAHYNLAAVLRSKGEIDSALPEFLAAAKLNPSLAGPHFQLFTLYQRKGDKANALEQRKLFEEAKKRDEGAAVPEDMEWCFYAELYDRPVDRASAQQRESTHYDDRTVSQGWNPSSSRMLLLDVGGTGHSDLLVWSPDRIAIFKNGTDELKATGLENLHDIHSVAAGDYDNDGLSDLCIVTVSGASIFHNQHGHFQKVSDVPNSGGTSLALWLDYDHDYDLDLLLFGTHPVLMRNDGAGKFEEKTDAFPFVSGDASDAALFAIRGDTAARDVLVSYRDRAGVLYRDNLNGVFETSDLPMLPAGSGPLAAADVNHDGLLDLVGYGSSSPLILISHAKDYNAAASFEVPKESVTKSSALASPVRADFNGDTREDYARITPDGVLHIYTNASADQRWATVRIEGVKNLKQAAGATVEMKSGPYYEKRVYTGTPLAFAVDGQADIDTIRITWPNGLIQNEPHQKAKEALKIEEAQRLSGSCPMIFTWDGEKFEFITDVLGVAPLGASSGDGTYFPVDHDEYIQIPGSALKAVNGKYQVHITEELHEVSYLDQVRLIALDHPANIDIYTNDKFKSPPYPDFRLFGSETKFHPVRAMEDGRVNATERLMQKDGQYPDSFEHNKSGAAKLHTLDLDFGSVAADNRAALILNGWVDWADGSTFIGASQSGPGLVFPYLQVKNDRGEWQTVVQDMGIPSGKPKTIAVDLTGKFLSASREIRIVTNLCVYWDEAFLIPNSAAPTVRLTPLDASTAGLAFRGFSKAVIDPARQKPEQFLYDDVRPVSNWNPTKGLYTRYGDVRPLLTAVDDKLVVMGSGDELKLEYDGYSLPPLRRGWTRDFLLLVDGWAKDSDANTAFSQTVGPLPFHAMSAYPYRKGEHFPDDQAHKRYLADYLTRPALRLIRPLSSNSAGD